MLRLPLIQSSSGNPKIPAEVKFSELGFRTLLVGSYADRDVCPPKQRFLIQLLILLKGVAPCWLGILSVHSGLGEPVNEPVRERVLRYACNWNHNRSQACCSGSHCCHNPNEGLSLSCPSLKSNALELLLHPFNSLSKGSSELLKHVRSRVLVPRIHNLSHNLVHPSDFLTCSLEFLPLSQNRIQLPLICNTEARNEHFSVDIRSQFLGAS